ncbi:6-pyruvoyl trahydropterin synthase family protein [Halomicrococcus sp. NG-SE-24]|uniref:6-pyruvoyl trahydropterin synthase family protein n=1 Tax=Halomicrococcus sp. NG-SE-24 TaxID=3436928 RepID=UPI003D966F81
MYELSVSRTFVAQHYLTVPDPGPEGELHSHRYEADLRLRGESLNEFGYLVDIDDVRAALDDVVERYRNATLNDLPEFEGENPSAEHLAREFCDRALAPLDADAVSEATLRLWEDEEAWVAFERPV